MIELDENEQCRQRLEKLEAISKERIAFPNDFTPSCTNNCALTSSLGTKVKVAGRILTRRLMGKASFFTIQDRSGKIQVYAKQDNIENYADFLNWDIGDIVGIEGEIFKTKTEEITVNASNLRLLVKALRPLPDKWHGLQDQELKYRQRYVDLIVNEATRNTFFIRSKTIQAIRNFLSQHEFLEVETPMMQVIPGGAVARPFVTHHNALDMDLYLRIAPELYLKRLVVGGLERVYEINRNFRNEGLSTRHNPEFTMLEFYQAYATYEQLMDFTEQLLPYVAKEALGTTVINYQGEAIDFSKPFTRLSVKEAILRYSDEFNREQLNDKNYLTLFLQKKGIKVDSSWGMGRLIMEVFEQTAEHKLIQPTFITEYPKEISPLARVNEANQDVTDRAELFIAGREIANLFSELNDPIDQAERFKEQVKAKESGDMEAMHYDADYITALEYGMPPTAGEGIGIDRLVMLFTNAPTIKDVILFPHMRPIK